MEKRLLCWYGLPGAGKSTRIEGYRAKGYPVFDDFMKNALYDNPRFPYSRHFVDIVLSLRTGAAVIADIRLCEGQYREHVVDILRQLLPQLEVEWHCFDCRPPEAVEICRDNVRYRAETTKRGSEHALRMIDHFAPLYSIAQDASVYSVVSARMAPF